MKPHGEAPHAVARPVPLKNRAARLNPDTVLKQKLTRILAMNTRKAIHPSAPHTLYAQHGYSPAIQSGDLLFVSGMVGARKDGTPEPDLKSQIQLAFDNLQGVLEAAACTFDDVVDVTMFLVDPEASAGLMIEAIAKAFPREPKPNATAVGVNWLAGFQFEIKVIARIPKH
jgi:enamine deaminase RidA (YjgF/YER057c/UK114 family)